MKILRLFLVCWLLLFVVASIQTLRAESPSTSTNLTDFGKQEFLAKQLYLYSVSRIDPVHFQFWFKQLDSNEYLPTDQSWSSKVKVRDVAVVCLESMAGMEFFPAAGSNNRHQVAEIISYKAVDDVYRYSISVYNDEEIRRIRFAIRCWGGGYSKGLRDGTTGAKLQAKEQKH